MEPSDDAIPKNCYQCGEPTFPLNLTEDAAKSGWFSCYRCGERIIPTADLAAIIRNQEELVVRRKLGVDEFLRTRRVNDQVADD